MHTSAVWTIIEVFKDADLLSLVRAELIDAGFTGDLTTYPVEHLLKLPLLNSVYAEVLRLRVEVQTVFYHEEEQITIGGWQVPRKTPIIVPVSPGHKDESFWNTENGKYPLDQFWAKRFLVNAPKPASNTGRPQQTHAKQESKTNGTPKLVTTGMANHFMPYGIGSRACPGQHYAKRQIMAFCAYIVHQYNVELLCADKHIAHDTRLYGLGTQLPKQKIKFRIQRRQDRQGGGTAKVPENGI